LGLAELVFGGFCWILCIFGVHLEFSLLSICSEITAEW
jgi:hypothetical protein